MYTTDRKWERNRTCFANISHGRYTNQVVLMENENHYEQIKSPSLSLSRSLASFLFICSLFLRSTLKRLILSIIASRVN